MFGIDDAVVGSLGGSLLSGLLNNSAASSRQEDAQAFSAGQYATRYQTTVKDLQAAGLNPMLAYTQGAGSAPGSSAASSAGFPDFGAAINQAKMNSAQIANIHADTANKAAQADLIAGQAAQAWASAGQSNANVGLINETVNKVKAETEKVRGDTNFEQQQQMLRNAVFNVYQQGALAQERGISEGQSRSLMQATIGKILNETALGKLDLEAALKFDNFGREAKQYEPIIDLFKTLIRQRSGK